MATEFTMPMLGETMEEGTITEWKKQVGQAIRKGEVIVEIETDKATMEVESTASGILLKILVEAGQTVPINTPIAIIGEEGESV